MHQWTSYSTGIQHKYRRDHRNDYLNASLFHSTTHDIAVILVSFFELFDEYLIRSLLRKLLSFYWSNCLYNSANTGISNRDPGIPNLSYNVETVWLSIGQAVF